MIRALIVDDEPQAREIIQHLLDDQSDIEVVGASDNGQDAVQLILERKPELIFLDIQMPELNGFEVAEVIMEDYNPQIVFVTAYDEYAIKAFEINAVDYIMKPYDDERFFQALDRAKSRISTKNDLDKAAVLKLLNSMILRNSSPVEDHFF